jgi:hypothetical protein
LAHRARNIAQQFAECSKHRFYKAFCDIINQPEPSLQAAENGAGSAVAAPGERSESTESAVKKNFGKCPRASDSVSRTRCESRESPAGDSRAASVAMTFWRQHRKAAPTFFRELGDRERTKSNTARTDERQSRG